MKIKMANRNFKFLLGVVAFIMANVIMLSYTTCGSTAPPSPTPTPTQSASPSPTLTPTQSASSPSPVEDNLGTSVNPSGSGSISPASGKYVRGTQLALQATPASACWVFDHWSGDLDGNTNPISYGLVGNKNITANFVKLKYILSTNISPPDSGSISPASTLYDCGDTVALTTTSAQGYQFDHWGGDASGNLSSTNITMNSNKNVTAYFKTTYQTITYEFPAGSQTSVSVSYSNQLKAGVRIQGFVELTGEYHSGDALYGWGFEILSPGMSPVYNWQGNVQSTPRNDFDYTTKSDGKYIIRISHVSRWPKKLTIQIRPTGWQQP